MWRWQAADAIDRVEILKDNILDEMAVHSGTWERRPAAAGEPLRGHRPKGLLSQLHALLVLGQDAGGLHQLGNGEAVRMAVNGQLNAVLPFPLDFKDKAFLDHSAGTHPMSRGGPTRTCWCGSGTALWRPPGW